MPSKNSPGPHPLVFFGTPDFAAICLKALLQDSRFAVKAAVTQADKAAGRGAKLSSSPVKKLALERGIPLLQPTSLRKERLAVLDTLKGLGPIDIGVVVAFGQLLPQELLDFPVSGCVNVHASLLPRWRGAAPIQRALLAGDAQSGVCLMRMEAGLDSGPVYSREEITIGAADNFGDLHDRLAALGVKMLLRDLEGIIRGEIEAHLQVCEGVTYAGKIEAAETVIKWEVPAEAIQRQIRAFAPSPGAYTFLNGKRLKLLRASGKAPRSAVALRPGRVHYVDRLCLEIECSSGVLSVTELQLEGKRRLPVKEFLLGAKIERDMVLGE